MKNNYVRYCLVLTAVFVCSLSTGYAWSYETAPRAGIYSVTADSTGQNITIDCYYGGIWHTNNGGLSWIPLNSSMDRYGRMSAKWQEYNESCENKKLILTDSWEGKNIYLTMDGCETWDFIRNEFNGPFIIDGYARSIISKHHSNRIYLMNRNCVAISDNFGETWESWQFAIHRFQMFEFKEDIFCDSVLYASSFYHNLIGDSSHVFVNGFMKSNDCGRTWDYLNPMIDFNSEFGIDVCRVYSFCQMSNGEFIVSVRYDREDWLNNNFIILNEDESIIGRSGSELPKAFIADEIIEDCEIPGRLYAIDDDPSFLFISDDYGRNWNKCETQGMPTGWQRINNVFQNSLSGDIFIASESFGLFKSEDNAQSWSKIPDPPIGLYGRLRIFENSIFLADHDHLHIWKNDQQDENWEQVNLPNHEGIQNASRIVYYSNDDTLVTLNEYYNRELNSIPSFKIIHSYDNGVNWQDVFNEPPYYKPIYDPAIYIRDSHCLISSFNEGLDSIAYSTDLGVSWSIADLSFEEGERITPFMFADDTNIIVATRGDIFPSKILRYNVESQVLEDLEFPFPNPGINYATMNVLGDSLFVLLQSAQFYLYDGTEWHQKTTQPGALSSGLAIIPSDPPVLVSSVVRHHALYLSNDFGETWNYTPIEHEYAKQNSRVILPQYDKYRHRIWIETGLGPMWIDADELVNSMGVEPVEAHPVEMDVISCYPNPFNASTRIKFNVSKPCEVKLRLYDVTGRLVKKCLNKYHNTGVHEYSLDASGLASGTYFARLDMNHQVFVEKLTLVK